MIGWEQLRYHPMHAELWRCQAKYVNVVSGRRSGKSEIAKRKIVVSLAIKKPWKDPLYAYLLPTYQQAKKVAWYPILNLIPEKWIAPNGINKSESTITTVFGSKLYIVGMDKPHRIEGIGLDGCVIDEASDHRPGMFEKTIVPMLGERGGWCWRIGVPKKNGICRSEFRDWFLKGLNGNDDNIKSFSWPSSEVWTEEQIELAKLAMDEQAYSEQCDAVWLEGGGSVYYAFSPDNVQEVRYSPREEITVGCDFNVSPMCWVLGHFSDGMYKVFDEVFLRDTNTRATLDFLYKKYSSHSAGWRFVGDASARQRKTSASRSDYLLIKNDSRFTQKKVFFPLRNPKLQDRYATVNSALCNAKGDIRVLIDPKCKRLLNDLNSISYKEGTTEIEDYTGTEIGHMIDAFGYAIMRVLPMRLEKSGKSSIVTV